MLLDKGVETVRAIDLLVWDDEDVDGGPTCSFAPLPDDDDVVLSFPDEDEDLSLVPCTNAVSDRCSRSRGTTDITLMSSFATF